MFDPSTINCNSIVNKFTACMKSVFIFGWTDEQIYLPIWIDEIGKNQDKWINETSVSSISTVWSIQSKSIKSDLPIFIDWILRVSIAVDVTIFGTNWDKKKIGTLSKDDDDGNENVAKKMIFQTYSRLFGPAQNVKCRRLLMELNS